MKQKLHTFLPASYMFCAQGSNIVISKQTQFSTMIVILGTIESLIFFLLSILHLSWAIGSKWGFEESLPKTVEGERVLNPTKKDSAIVGVGLLFFAIFYRIKVGIIPIDLPSWTLSIAGWVISVIFLFRAMGDFKYVGFFKKVSGTDFATNDTKYYSPLCLVLGLLGILLEVLLNQ